MEATNFQQITDEELFKGLRTGDTKYHLCLQRKYAKKLLRFIYNKVKNFEDAKEILNDVLYATILKIDTYSSRASLKTWIYTIALNCSRDFLAKKIREERFITIAEKIKPERLPAEKQEDNPTPQAVILKEILEKMRERDRILLELYYIAGFTGEEIATYLGVKEGAIRVGLYRARNRLRNKLATYPEFKSYFQSYNCENHKEKEDEQGSIY
ncbi:hypothetical protein ES702_04188 [subsurface metagenome]